MILVKFALLALTRNLLKAVMIIFNRYPKFLRNLIKFKCNNKIPTFDYSILNLHPELFQIWQNLALNLFIFWLI